MDTFSKELNIDTQCLNDDYPPSRASTFTSTRTHEDDNSCDDEARRIARLSITPPTSQQQQTRSNSLVRSTMNSISKLATQISTPFSTQTVKEYFVEAAESHATSDEEDRECCICSPPKLTDDECVQEQIGVMTRRIMMDGHPYFPFYDDTVKRIFYYLYAKKVDMAVKLCTNQYDKALFERIASGDETVKELQCIAGLMVARGNEFIPEDSLDDLHEWQTLEAFKTSHPLQPNPEEYYDIFQDGTRPLRHNQVFGTCYIHAVVTLIYYLIMRTDPNNTWVIDIMRYIRNGLDANALLDHILDRGRDSKKVLKQLLPSLTWRDFDFNIEGNDLIEKLKEYGPFLVSSFEVTHTFLNEPFALHTTESFDGNDLTGEKHAMVVVGVWEPKGGEMPWILLQNSHKKKQFAWVEHGYLKLCQAQMHGVKTSISRGDVAAHNAWHDGGSKPFVIESSSPMILTSETPEPIFER